LQKIITPLRLSLKQTFWYILEMREIYGAIEAGGTKFNCAAGTDENNILEEIRISTETPEKTLSACAGFFRDCMTRHGQLRAIGIGSFGPVDPDPDSPTWGHITSTPKKGWKNTDIAGYFKKEFGVPVGFDTDVNAAALGEGTLGAAKGLDDFVYITVGTGIGGGIVCGGNLIHGLTHPEIGHVLPGQDKEQDPFEGICPYHGNCMEGLASGPAIQARWNTDPRKLPGGHPAWDLEASYLARLAASCMLFYSPKKIIFGGGIMHERSLFPKIRMKTLELLAGYIQNEAVLEKMDELIVSPELEDRAGLTGAFVLAENAVRSA
jgi:fructokinase